MLYEFHENVFTLQEHLIQLSKRKIKVFSCTYEVKIALLWKSAITRHIKVRLHCTVLATPTGNLRLFLSISRHRVSAG